MGALAARLDLRGRVARSLRGVDVRGRRVVVALGKGAPAMARGALDALGDVDALLVVTSDATDALGLPVRRAAHPLPDARSVAAGAEALALSRSLGPDDTLVALVSGGASALACAPAPPLDLAEKRALGAAMLASGAPVEAVNTVRRHASLLKGGGLLGAHRTIVRVASDVLVARAGSVVPGDAAVVGSGPASACPTTVADARVALARWAPAHASVPLVEHHGAPDDERIVIDPTDLADAARAVLVEAGFSAGVAEPTLDTVAVLAARLRAEAARLGPGEALVRVGEPSVALPAVHGAGGRLGRLALLALRGGLPEGVHLVALASDGVDGSGGAGAVVTGRAYPSVEAALAAWDDAPWLEARGALVARAPSGLNLLDLIVLLREGT